jgi:hypothetical protein
VKYSTGTLRKNVTQVQKTGKISVEQSFFAGCPSMKQTALITHYVAWMQNIFRVTTS